jgi:hypothetical protein
MGSRSLLVLCVVLAGVLPACRTLSFRSPKQHSEVVVAAWAEPARLPPSGGQVQILVRIQRPNGEPYPGVQVRLKASAGKLYSGGKTLVTDASGMTRDRLTAKQPSDIVVLVGDTRHRFRVELASKS